MANKRKAFEKKERLIKSGKRLLDTGMCCDSSTVSIKSLPPVAATCESPPATGTGSGSGAHSLGWLVNLSAASLFTQQPYSTQVGEERLERERETKPGLTYTELIEKALKENGELTVSEIYKWIYTNYPYFKKNDGRWKNSIRHNLSINPQFRKGIKCSSGGHFWTLNKEYDEQFKKWQEHKKNVRIPEKSRRRAPEEDEEVERATRSILPLLEETYSEESSHGSRHGGCCGCGDCPIPNGRIGSLRADPSLVRVATDILNGIDKQVEVEFITKSDMASAPIVIEEDLLDCSDPILSDPLLFSDCLELGFQPYELIESRL